MESRKDENTITNKKIKHPDLINFISYDKGIELIFHKSLIPKALSDVVSGKFIAVNKAWENFTGYKAKEIIGKTIESLNIIENDERKSIKEKLDKNGNLNSYEAKIFDKNGIVKEVILSFDKIVFKENNLVLSEILDISELKKSRESLKAEKEFSENLISSMNEGLIVVTTDNKITSINPAFSKMTGYTQEELIEAELPFPFWAPEHYDTCYSFYNKLLKENVYKPYETYYKRKNGERFPVHITTSQIKDKEGKVKALFATVQDITERVKSQNEIRLAKDYLENLISSLQEGIVVTNLDYEIIKVNPAFCKMLGYTENELLGLKSPYPFSPPEIRDEVNHRIRKFEKGELQTEFESVYIHKKGHRFPISATASPIFDSEGKKVAYFGTVQDITDHKKLQNSQRELAERSNKKKNVILELANLVGEEFSMALNRITSLAAETLQVERVSVWSFNEDYTIITCEKLHTLSSLTFEKGLKLHRSDNPNYFDALNENKTICISDTSKSQITKGFFEFYLKPHGITAMMDVFIGEFRRPYGIICFEHVGSNRNWTAEEEFATSIASLVSLMVQSRKRLKAEYKLKEINEELTKAVNELEDLKSRLENENIYLRNELDMVFNFEEMVYGSAAFSEVLSNIEKVAPSDATVLLLGDTGTGKELLARAVHNLSNRREKPLIKVNCAAIPKELIESELFGHKKGSFTGALQDKIGKLELAHEGTLFLDEIGELPISMQPKLLRFLQEGEIEIIGESRPKKINVRVIAATNRDLKKEIKKKRFREDLYFRLNVFPIKVPSLKDRKEDIPLLIEHFIDKFNKLYRKNIKYISDNAFDELQNYHWPGNIRELENLIERAVILSNAEHLVLPDYSIGDDGSNRHISNTNLSLDEVQRNYIIKVLESCNWKIDGVNGASRILKIKPSTLRDRIKKLNISKPN